MSTPAILDVAIGLALLYLMLSLLVSLTSEFISRLLDLRAKTLRGWLERFLDGEVKTPLPGVLTSNTTTKAFYDLPLITALKNKKAKHLPSYIPSKTFATALLDLALPAKDGMPDSLKASITGVEGTNLPPQVKEVIIAHLRTADNNLEKTREELALWFDGAMERVSGWYARRMQVFTLLIALAVAIIANADTFLIADTLSNDKDLRKAVVDLVTTDEAGKGNLDFVSSCLNETSSEPANSGSSDQQTNISNHQKALEECYKQLEGFYAKVALPLFNHVTRWDKATKVLRNPPILLISSNVWGYQILDKVLEWLLRYSSFIKWILGLVVTAAALSFGARFWFDVLTKLVNIRLTGKPPEGPSKNS